MLGRVDNIREFLYFRHILKKSISGVSRLAKIHSVKKSLHHFLREFNIKDKKSLDRTFGRTRKLHSFLYETIDDMLKMDYLLMLAKKAQDVF